MKSQQVAALASLHICVMHHPVPATGSRARVYITLWICANVIDCLSVGGVCHRDYCVVPLDKTSGRNYRVMLEAYFASAAVYL